MTRYVIGSGYNVSRHNVSLRLHVQSYSLCLCVMPEWCFKMRLDISLANCADLFASQFLKVNQRQLGRVKRIWFLSPMRAAKVQVSLRIRAVSPEPPLLTHTSSESGGTFRQKARSLASLNGWACAVKICHDEMLEDTNPLDAPQLIYRLLCSRVNY